MKKAVYRLKKFFGRMGDIDMIFVSNPDEIDKMDGRMVELGEVLGKYSDIRFKFSKHEIEMLSKSKQVVEFYEDKLNGGYHPYRYMNQLHRQENN